MGHPLDCTYNPVNVNPFLLFIKPFKKIARIRNVESENSESAINPRMRIRRLIRFFLYDSEREFECGPKIRRIAIPRFDSFWY